jgi:chromosome segregation ATPase
VAFGIGTVAGFFIRKRKHKKQIEANNKVLDFLKTEYLKPILHDFSGPELANASLVLLDATIECYLRDTPKNNTKYSQYIETYLEKIEEIYEMNKDALEESPVSRKEIIALGLAVRFISVNLDREFDSLNTLKTDIDSTKRDVQNSLRHANLTIESLAKDFLSLSNISQKLSNNLVQSQNDIKELLKKTKDLEVTLNQLTSSSEKLFESLSELEKKNQELTNNLSLSNSNLEILKKNHHKTRQLIYFIFVLFGIILLSITYLFSQTA